MKEKRYEPLEDRILIEETKKEGIEQTDGGLYKLGEKPEKTGVVMRVGPGFTARDTGKFIPTVLKMGDGVIFVPNSAIQLDLSLDGGPKKEYWLMREGDVLIKV